MRHPISISVMARFLGLGGILLSSCATNFENLPAYNAHRQLQAVIEIPAGTNQMLKYEAKTKEFKNTTGKEIRFLPFPGNYGFVPSTRVSGNRGGDDQPLDILVLAESEPSGTVQEVLPVGILQLERDGLLDPKIIAVPASPSQQIITATDLASLTRNYPAIKNILTQWFAHANPSQKVRIIGWQNEHAAEEYIRKVMR